MPGEACPLGREMPSFRNLVQTVITSNTELLYCFTGPMRFAPVYPGWVPVTRRAWGALWSGQQGLQGPSHLHRAHCGLRAVLGWAQMVPRGRSCSAYGAGKSRCQRGAVQGGDEVTGWAEATSAFRGAEFPEIVWLHQGNNSLTVGCTGLCKPPWCDRWLASIADG